jgi:hypothetical protein
MRHGFARIRSVTVRNFSLCALLTLTAVALGPAQSFGQTTVGSFQGQRSLSESVTNYPCFEGLTVTMTGTITAEGHFTEVDPQHFSVHGTDTIDYRVDFGDGRYAVGQVTDHFGFGINFNRPRTVDAGAQQEQATVYAADGTPIGTITVHVTIHVIYTDVNQNFEPDPGEITTSLERVRATCP